MANLALVAGDHFRPVSGVANGHEQYTFEAEERINKGQVFRIDGTTGKATLANGSVAGEAGPDLYIAIDGARNAGQGVTGMKSGMVEGYDLDALGYGAVVYLSNTDGTPADTAGTVSTVIGRVIPSPVSGNPSVQDKILRVNFAK